MCFVFLLAHVVNVFLIFKDAIFASKLVIFLWLDADYNSVYSNRPSVA
jgi:hypothetical protein